jgi:hypothetical protein
MLTSTLTRPTTISPTSSCETPVSLMEVVDVAPIPMPKPRVISLEPISRRARTKPSRKRSPARNVGSKALESAESTKSGRVSELNSVVGEGDAPESPSPSDTSFGSRVSSGNASGTEYGIRSVHTALESNSTGGSKQTLKSKTITATIEVQKGGFLRGDQIPIKISVDHTKHVRSLKGIIITLYRQARVDMHPALPVAPNSKGDKTKSEDYYPKSRTGLGGLSLSSAGSTHLFRKDLSQSFAPLFVDPRTLKADVKCAVRVPDEAFPTISNVPGAMISFKYFVEIVVDIQGKLSNLDRMLPNAGLVNVPTDYGNSPTMRRAEDPARSMFSTWGGSFADTDAIRREKSVVSCLFEVIIGTKDSDRNGKQRQKSQDLKPEAQPNIDEFSNDDQHTFDAQDQDYYGYDEQGQYYDEYGYEGAYDEAPNYLDPGTHHPPYNPPPDPGNGEELSEKERIRRAEARLLPSQPPNDGGPSSPLEAQRGIPPSAPMLPEDDEPYPTYFAPGPSASASAPSSQPPPPFSVTTPPASYPPVVPAMQRRTTDDDNRTMTGSSLTIDANPRQSSSPSGDDLNPSKPLPALPPPSPAPVPNYLPSSSSSHVEYTDDKQELQRRRLEMETSAPPTDSPDDGPSSHAPAAPPQRAMQNLALAPSAPVLDDEDEGLVDAVHRVRSRQPGEQDAGEELPGYQR